MILMPNSLPRHIDTPIDSFHLFQGETALHLTTSADSEDIVHILIAAGADLDASCKVIIIECMTPEASECLWSCFFTIVPSYCVSVVEADIKCAIRLLFTSFRMVALPFRLRLRKVILASSKDSQPRGRTPVRLTRCVN